MNQERLKELLDYDIFSGLFVWKLARGRAKEGEVAGTTNKANGYIQIKVDGVSFYSHRLAWLYVHGFLPPNEIDHKNHIRSDNRMRNLRLSTRQQNQKNKTLRKDNRSGQTGVSWNKANNKWAANIGVDGKYVGLGLHSDINDAIAARKSAEVRLGYHENHGRKQ